MEKSPGNIDLTGKEWREVHSSAFSHSFTEQVWLGKVNLIHVNLLLTSTKSQI